MNLNRRELLGTLAAIGAGLQVGGNHRSGQAHATGQAEWQGRPGNMTPEKTRLTRLQWDEDLKGRACYGGMDLALMWDLSAFVLCFPWGRTKDNRRLMQYRLKSYFQIPEEGYAVLVEKVPALRDWKDRNFITVTAGNSFDEETFCEKILESRSDFDLRGVAYDPKYAHSLAQRLQDGNGILVESFNQSGITFAPCVDHFEKAVANHVMYHDGNPVLTWCAQNVTIYERPGNLKLLKKPVRGNHKKIDGIVAAVMALGMSLSKPEVTSIYEEEGALFG